MQGRCYSRWQLNGPSGGYLLAATRHIVSKWIVGNPTSIKSTLRTILLSKSISFSTLLQTLDLLHWPGVMWLFFTFNSAQYQFVCVVTAWTLVKWNCGYFEANCGYFEVKSNMKSVPANIWQPHAQYWDWPFTFRNLLIFMRPLI